MAIASPWDYGRLPRRCPFTNREYTEAEMITAEALRIREALKTNKGVHLTCFNKEEADQIRSRLTPPQRERVTFSWHFGRPTDGT
jgi:hypothetical protein